MERYIDTNESQGLLDVLVVVHKRKAVRVQAGMRSAKKYARGL